MSGTQNSTAPVILAPGRPAYIQSSKMPRQLYRTMAAPVWPDG
jgi:hypothetical protein